jgi:regulator of replication initiation timing
MPYPNFHSCRLVDPDKLDIVGSGEREHDGKKYRVIFGKPKGDGGSVEQGYRYPIEEWTKSEAWFHCLSHNGIFEPASRETSASKRDQLVEYIHGKGFRRAEDLVEALVDLLGEDLFTLVPESRAAGVELRFWAAVHSIETGEEKRLVTFYLLNTSLNLNNWRVTNKSLEDAYPTLLRKPLGCKPGYRVNHVHKPLKVGEFVRSEKPDGYLLGTAEISDDIAWDKVSSGEWGPVSVVIRAYRVTCSVCGEDVTNEPDEHIKSGEGHEVIESFKFERVDFVSDPAYPQSDVLTLGHLASTDGLPGVLYTASVVSFEETVKASEDRPWDADAAEARVRSWAGGPDKDNVNWSKYRRAFAWYDAEDPENFGSYKLLHHDVINGRLHVIWKGVVAAMQVTLGARDGVDIPRSEHRGTYNHLSKHYSQFSKTPPPYHTSQSNMDGVQGPRGNPKPDETKEKKKMEAQVEELQQELETLKADHETLKTENTQLKADKEELEGRVKVLEDERHQEHINAALEARFKAGLVKDREAEAERLKELGDSTLALLAEDAEKVAEKLAKAPPTGPKAKYTADDKSAFEAAVEDTRERLFGHRKEAS